MNYRTLVALFITVASLSVQAEQRWFEVELLIFERNAEIDDINEHLSSDKISIDTENSISLLEPIRTSICIEGETCLSKENPTIITGSVFDSEGNNFQRLDKSRLQLVKQREKLQRHASFEPVFHMAWRMPVKGPQASKPIHLFAGENLAFNIQKRLLENISLQSSDAVATELSDGEAISLITDKWAIDGNFKVYLNHYLFIDTQLVIRKEITEDIKQPDPIVVEVVDDENGVQIATQSEQAVVTEVKQQTVIKEILFDQNRRLRSEEVHYLDHPLMGIIVQIRKIPKVERKEEL
ncbi:MAG: hypothetical protein GY787_20910 [Alteromonadales bacterium]|nr:hypothetical protein [Alteromonadales bacterium]